MWSRTRPGRPSSRAGLVEAADGTEALVLVTEWPQFAEIDLRELRRVMRGGLLLDGRNVVNPEAARSAGFIYVGAGR